MSAQLSAMLWRERHGSLRYHCVAFVLDRSALLKKKGPLAGPLRKWRMFRPPLSLWEENGVLRTSPLKRSGGLVTSKLAVNLLVADAPLVLSCPTWRTDGVAQNSATIALLQYSARHVSGRRSK